MGIRCFRPHFAFCSVGFDALMHFSFNALQPDSSCCLTKHHENLSYNQKISATTFEVFYLHVEYILPLLHKVILFSIWAFYGDDCCNSAVYAAVNRIVFPSLTVCYPRKTIKIPKNGEPQRIRHGWESLSTKGNLQPFQLSNLSKMASHCGVLKPFLCGLYLGFAFFPRFGGEMESKPTNVHANIMHIYSDQLFAVQDAVCDICWMQSFLAAPICR